MVTIDGSAGDMEATISVIGVSGDRAKVGIEGVTVTGGYIGVLVGDRTVVSMKKVTVAANEFTGVRIEYVADVTLDEVVVRDTVPVAGVNSGGGIVVSYSASLLATNCVVAGNAEYGIYAGEVGTHAELVNTAVLDTTPTRTDSGYGLAADFGAMVLAEGCTFRGNTEKGVDARYVGTLVELVDTAVLDTLPNPFGGEDGEGIGISVVRGAELSATRCTVQGNTEAGVYVQGAEAESTSVELVDTDVLDTVPGPKGLGYGIVVGAGAALVARECTVQGNTGTGISVDDHGTFVELVDTDVLDTAPSAVVGQGRGIVVQTEASLVATDCTVQGNTEVGVYAGEGATVELVDTAILDTLLSADGAGHGIAVEAGASLTANGCTVERSATRGVNAGGVDTYVELVDTEIRDGTTGGEVTYGGMGIVLSDEAHLVASGSTIQGNTYVALLVTDVGTLAELTDTAVLDTHRGRETAFAAGVVVQTGGKLTATRCEISGTEGPGAYSVNAGELVLSGCTLAGNSFAGALAGGGDATLRVDTTTITDTLPDAEYGGGFGVYAIGAGGPVAVTLTDSTIGPHRYAAVWLDGQGSYDLRDNSLSGSDGFVLGQTQVHGNAIFAQNGVGAWDGNLGLHLAGNDFTGAPPVAVLLHDASATLDGNSWSGALHVLQQDCRERTSEVVAPESDWRICPGGGNILVDQDVEFLTLFLREADNDE